ncbi:MAG: hypothetical protein WAM69_11725 [Candidatus Sulfotelmatobacter sp.]
MKVGPSNQWLIGLSTFGNNPHALATGLGMFSFAIAPGDEAPLCL